MLKLAQSQMVLIQAASEATKRTNELVTRVKGSRPSVGALNTAADDNRERSQSAGRLKGDMREEINFLAVEEFSRVESNEADPVDHCRRGGRG